MAPPAEVCPSKAGPNLDLPGARVWENLGESGQNWEGLLQRLAPGVGVGLGLICVTIRSGKQSSSHFQMNNNSYRGLRALTLCQVLAVILCSRNSIHLSHKCGNRGSEGFKTLPSTEPGARPGQARCSGLPAPALEETSVLEAWHELEEEWPIQWGGHWGCLDSGPS